MTKAGTLAAMQAFKAEQMNSPKIHFEKPYFFRLISHHTDQSKAAAGRMIFPQNMTFTGRAKRLS